MTRVTGRSGFTLIELLVVIAIIAILAAILFPVFQRAMEKARQSNCISNLKQIGIAIRSYTTDNGNFYPTFCSWGDDGLIAFPDQMNPYTKNNQIFICPSDAVNGSFKFYESSAQENEVADPMSYWPNTGILRPCSWILMYQKPAPALSNVRYPAETPIMWDGDGYAYGFPPSGWRGAMVQVREIGSWQDPDHVERHNEGVCVLFADGHTKWLTGEEKYGNDWAKPGHWDGAWPGMD
ncbi:MAG: DUF1559 domain-containing protein [Armatimonadia bacterium]|nr:DUF1559 domain-containing protein [Armatimonadia bacterium]